MEGPLANQSLLSKSVNAIHSIPVQQPVRHLYPADTRLEVVRRAHTGEVRGPEDMGNALLAIHHNRLKTDARMVRDGVPQPHSIFHQSYQNKDRAIYDWNVGVNNLAAHRQDFSKVSLLSDHGKMAGPCHMFPPLLVEYNGSKDKYTPLKIFDGGEVHPTKSIPDIVLNFHADTRAITLSLCEVEKERTDDYNVVVTTLYAMQSDMPLTVSSFSKMYDQKRAEILQFLKVRNVI